MDQILKSCLIYENKFFLIREGGYECSMSKTLDNNNLIVEADLNGCRNRWVGGVIGVLPDEIGSYSIIKISVCM